MGAQADSTHDDMQGFSLISNVQPTWPEMPPEVVCQATSSVPVAHQSNHTDCGCHAIMNIRVLASSLVRSASSAHMALHFFEGEDVERDAHWRYRLGSELVSGEVDLVEFEQYEQQE